MKKSIFYLLGLFFIIFSSCSCNDDSIIIDTPIIEPEVDTTLIWKVPLDSDTLNTLSLDEIAFYNNKIVTSSNPVSNSNDEIILCYDDEGNEIWRWDDYSPQNKPQRINDEKRIGNYLVVSSGKDNYCFNIESGNEEWRFVFDYGAPKLSVGLDGLVFLPIYYSEQSPRSDSTSIMMGNVENGDFKEIFKIRKTGEYEVAIPNVIPYINSNGDTIIIFQNNNLRISPYEEVIDLYSYNYSTKELNWCKKSLTDKSWNINEPVLDDTNIYFATKFRFFSIDKVTGEINWERLMPHDFQGSNYLLYEDLLITNLDNGDLIAISKHSGETVWHKERLGACCIELRIYEDKIYMGNGDLFIIEALTGEVLFQYKTSSKKERGRSNALFLNAVAVDLDNQRMYATDGYYLLCLKHPKL
jgi:outer membrane protein assembly factor BamB